MTLLFLRALFSTSILDQRLLYYFKQQRKPLLAYLKSLTGL